MTLDEIHARLAATPRRTDAVRWLVAEIEGAAERKDDALAASLWSVVLGIATAGVSYYGADPREAFLGVMNAIALRNTTTPKN